jgi:hypothetical protein
MTRLTPKQVHAITALITTTNFRAAAKAVGVTPETIRRWMREESLFQEAYEDAIADLGKQGRDKLQAALHEAVDTVREGLKAEKQCDRLRAAAIIIEYALRDREVRDLARELTSIRAVVQAKHVRYLEADSARTRPAENRGGANADGHVGADPAGGRPDQRLAADGADPGCMAGESAEVIIDPATPTLFEAER